MGSRICDLTRPWRHMSSRMWCHMSHRMSRHMWHRWSHSIFFKFKFTFIATYPLQYFIVNTRAMFCIEKTSISFRFSKNIIAFRYIDLLIALCIYFKVANSTSGSNIDKERWDVLPFTNRSSLNHKFQMSFWSQSICFFAFNRIPPDVCNYI